MKIFRKGFAWPFLLGACAWILFILQKEIIKPFSSSLSLSSSSSTSTLRLATPVGTTQQQEQQNQRACVAHYLCGGCSYATEFQKTKPTHNDDAKTCQDLKNALVEQAGIHDIHNFCISDEFCQGPLADALEQGHFTDIPSTAKRIWIDLGADWTTFTSRCAWEQLQWSQGRSTCQEFIQSPDIHAIAVDANKAFMPQLGALERVTPVATAIGLQNSIVVFNHYAAAGCSSMNDPNPNIRGAPASCKKVARREVAPLLRMDLLVDLIPTHLDIEFLKIDVQGQDLNAAQSLASRLPQRISKVYIEAQDDGYVPLTLGQPTKSQVIDWFQQQGFVWNQTQSAVENPKIGEWNLMFDNKAKLPGNTS